MQRIRGNPRHIVDAGAPQIDNKEFLPSELMKSFNCQVNVGLRFLHMKMSAPDRIRPDNLLNAVEEAQINAYIILL